MNIAQIFSLIESNKETLDIETYLLSQTTLEQIFISFARKQIGHEDASEDVSGELVTQTERKTSDVSVHFNKKRDYTNIGFAAEETFRF